MKLCLDKLIFNYFRISVMLCNYLIDEASNTGKGANTIISLVHYFLPHVVLGKHQSISLQ